MNKFALIMIMLFAAMSSFGQPKDFRISNLAGEWLSEDSEWEAVILHDTAKFQIVFNKISWKIRNKGQVFNFDGSKTVDDRGRIRHTTWFEKNGRTLVLHMSYESLGREGKTLPIRVDVHSWEISENGDILVHKIKDPKTDEFRAAHTYKRRSEKSK